MVQVEQIAALIDFLENHRDLALGHINRTNEGRNLAKRRWTECAQILNSISVDCPNKTPAEWRTFFNEYKSKLIKKIKLQKREISATGGGPVKRFSLTPLQGRLYDILGRDVGEPHAHVRHNRLTPIITLPVVDAGHSPSTSNLSNDSFSIFGTYVLPNITVTPDVEIAENNQAQFTSSEQNIEDPSSHQPSRQPIRRRRHQRSALRSTADDYRGHTALEAAQTRLEAIEAKNADATLKHAEATNNLAAAIEKLSSSADKMVDLMGQIVMSLSKKIPKN